MNENNNQFTFILGVFVSLVNSAFPSLLKLSEDQVFVSFLSHSGSFLFACLQAVVVGFIAVKSRKFFEKKYNVRGGENNE